MKNWKITYLGEIADVIDPHPSHRAPPETNDGIPFPGIGDFTEDGALDLASCRSVSSSVYNEHHQRYAVKKGDIGFGRVASIGKVVKLRVELLPYAISPTLAVIKPHDVNPDYLRHFLKGPQLKEQIRSLLTGSTRSSLGIALLRNLKISLPDIHEQQTISAVLSSLDKAIEQTEAIIAKQQRIKTGLMQDLLTKGIDENGNIRTEATHEFKDSPLGHIPVGWEIKNLEHVTSHIIDCPHTTPSFVAGGVLVARTFNIKDSIFIEKNVSYVTEAEFKDRISRLEPQPGDIIFTREAPVGEAFLIPDGMRICLGQRTMLIRCDGKYCDPIYLIETLYSLEMRIRFDQMVGGTTNPHLNVADVRKLLVKIPPVEEQNRISNILEINRKALNDAQSQKCKLEVLKRGLMHDLLTGKVRVTDIQNPTLTPESL
jgi:type I restriction enzyme S subunit